LILLFFLLVAGLNSFAQIDSIPQKKDTTAQLLDSIYRHKPDSSRLLISKDSTKKTGAVPVSYNSKIDSVLKYHSPRKAAIRSAIVPGLGQIYNQKYWKVPIIYGALGISASVFVYNLKWYRRTRFAYTAKTEASQPPYDSANYWQIHPSLIHIDINALRSYRDEFRRNVDYSALVFMLLWGLQVVDATVDAHLKSFDVSPDLSLKLKIGPSQMAGTNGVSLVLAFNQPKYRKTTGF
jgi:hypothetical protein